MRQISKHDTSATPHPVDICVGKAIRYRRKLLGLSQEQLADAVGIKFQQIQKYETGKNRVSASRLWELAGALDVKISFFFQDIEDTPAPTKARDKMATRVLFERETLDLVRSYYDLPEKSRRSVFKLIRSFAETD